MRRDEFFKLLEILTWPFRTFMIRPTKWCFWRYHQRGSFWGGWFTIWTFITAILVWMPVSLATSPSGEPSVLSSLCWLAALALPFALLALNGAVLNLRWHKIDAVMRREEARIQMRNNIRRLEAEYDKEYA